MMTLAMLVGVAYGAGVAECAQTYSGPEIADAVASAEGAFGRLDATAFASARSAMEARLACAGEKLGLDVIARIHRVEAFAAILERRDDRMAQALAGLFAVEPGHQIPVSLVPEGHPLRKVIPNAMTALREDERTDLPILASGWFDVDGSASPNVPAGRAAMVEQIDSQNALVSTHYRWPDELGFAWVVQDAVAPVGDVPTTRPTARRWTRRTPLLAAAAASLATSGALLAMAADSRAEFDARPTLADGASGATREAYRTELEGVQARANGLTYGGYVAAGAGLTLGVVTVIAW
jgi:hypothetical protein